MELENRSVLFLNGQYLEEYLPVTGRYPRPRQFPCTEFTIRRHKESGHVVDVLCSGTVFEPELVAPPFLDKGLEKYSSLDEASIMKGKTYDELKAEHTLR